MAKAAFVTNDTTMDPAEVRRESIHGSEYLVAPVVAVKEMVLNGGFLPYDEIEKSVPGWNGRPVTLHHPEDEHGNFVSANHPDVHDAHVYGRLFNATADEDVRGLLAELWLHAGVAQSLGGEAQQTVEMLEASDPLEVSTGYFMEPVPEPGRHDGESYDQFQTNVMPDHLATLPGGQGACSVEDGCGAPRANADGGKTMFQTVRHAGHVLTGQECDCGGHSGDTDMNDKINAVLADAVGVEFEDPDEPTDDELTALEEALAEEPDEPPADDDEQNLTAEEVEELMEQRERARTRNDLIDRILDAQDADPEEDDDAWNRETLEEVNSEAALERILADVSESDGGGAVGFGGDVNYVGRGASEPSGQENSEWDDYEVPTTVNFGGEEEEQEAD